MAPGDYPARATTGVRTSHVTFTPEVRRNGSLPAMHVPTRRAGLIVAGALAALLTAALLMVTGPAVADSSQGLLRRGSARLRASRGRRLPAGAHARVLRARGAHGRGLHRARPRAARRTACSSRATSRRSAGRPTSPTTPSSPTARRRDGRRRRAHRAGSPRTSRSPSSRRCAPRSASRTCASATRSTTAATRSRRCRRSSTSPRGCPKELRRTIAIAPETKHSTYFAVDRPAARAGARRDAGAERLGRQGRAGRRPVLRDEEPAGR